LGGGIAGGRLYLWMGWVRGLFAAVVILHTLPLISSKHPPPLLISPKPPLHPKKHPPRAFRKLALKLHPDKAMQHCRYSLRLGGCGVAVIPGLCVGLAAGGSSGGGSALDESAAAAAALEARIKSEAGVLFNLINEASEELSDAVRRRKVDQLLDAESDPGYDRGYGSSGGGGGYERGFYNTGGGGGGYPSYGGYGGGGGYGGYDGGGYGRRGGGSAYGSTRGGGGAGGGYNQQQQQRSRPQGNGGGWYARRSAGRGPYQERDANGSDDDAGDSFWW